MEKYLTGTFERQYKKINKIKLQDEIFLQKLNNCKVRLMKGSNLNEYKSEYIHGVKGYNCEYLYRVNSLREYKNLKFNENKYYKVWDYVIDYDCYADKHPLSVLYIEPYDGKVFRYEFAPMSEQEREIELIENVIKKECDAIYAKYDEKLTQLENEFTTPKQL